MGDRAETAEITLQVSDDGSEISWLLLSFANVKCDEYNSESSKYQESGPHPILNGGKLEIAGEFGKLTGTFTSPTAVAGSIELKVWAPEQLLQTYHPCGTWDWSASQE